MAADRDVVGAGGEGVSCARANNVIFVDREWTPAKNTQAEDRPIAIGKTAMLEFRLVSDDMELIKQARDGKVPEGYELVKDERTNEELLIAKDTYKLIKKGN